MFDLNKRVKYWAIMERRGGTRTSTEEKKGVGGGGEKSDQDAHQHPHNAQQCPHQPHLQPNSHLQRAHSTGVFYQGCADTGLNKGKSLLANHTKDGHLRADSVQPNKWTSDYYLKFKDILHTWKDYLWHVPK